MGTVDAQDIEYRIYYQVCMNPDVNCMVVERAHRTIRDTLHKYFTYKNTF